MTDQLTLQINSSLDSLRSANEAVCRWLADRGMPAEIQNFASLAIEELATNVIKYGYDDANKHLIEVRLSLSHEDLVLTIADDGRPFNPLEAPEPEVSAALEERLLGGLGIYLVRRMSDCIEYVREGRKNRLTLHKGFVRGRGE